MIVWLLIRARRVCRRLYSVPHRLIKDWEFGVISFFVSTIQLTLLNNYQFFEADQLTDIPLSLRSQYLQNRPPQKFGDVITETLSSTEF